MVRLSSLRRRLTVLSLITDSVERKRTTDNKSLVVTTPSVYRKIHIHIRGIHNSTSLIVNCATSLAKSPTQYCKLSLKDPCGEWIIRYLYLYLYLHIEIGKHSKLCYSDRTHCTTKTIVVSFLYPYPLSYSTLLTTPVELGIYSKL